MNFFKVTLLLSNLLLSSTQYKKSKIGFEKSDSSSSNDLINAYYARKMQNDSLVFKQETNAEQTKPEAKPKPEMSTTQLHWDAENNIFIEASKAAKLKSNLSIDVASPSSREQPLSPTSSLITTHRFLQGSASSLSAGPASAMKSPQMSKPENYSPGHSQLLTSSSVVSKIKSWLSKPTNDLKSPQSAAIPNAYNLVTPVSINNYGEDTTSGPNLQVIQSTNEQKIPIKLLFSISLLIVPHKKVKVNLNVKTLIQTTINTQKKLFSISIQQLLLEFQYFRN